MRNYVLIRQDLQDGNGARFMTVKTDRQGFKFHLGTNGELKCELPWIRKNSGVADNYWNVIEGFDTKFDCKVRKQQEEDAFLSVPGRTIYTNLHYNNMKVRRKS